MHIHGVSYTPLNIFKFLSANIIVSLLVMFSFLTSMSQNPENFLIGFLWSFSITFTQWTGLQLIHTYIDRKISWIETPVKKTIIQISAFLLYSMSAFILIQFVNYYIWIGTLPAESWYPIIRSVPYTLLISLVITLIFTSIGFFVAWKQSFVQGEKLKLEMMAYKYESLRNQINPHFLFNSLNVLSDLVFEDPALAVKFIQQLSDLFRYVLDSRDKELVPLKEEMEFIRSFTFLLKTRFENKLIIENEVQESADDYIVPMTLQLLVENAVKHNEISESYPLWISIRKNHDYLEVENRVQPKKAGEDSKQIGLKNINQQFAFFSERPIEILTSEKSFLVRVPILNSFEK